MRESEYIEKTSIKHRKDYGQFFTPSSVSRLMVQWVLKDNPATILDPAFGLGIFYDELVKAKPIQEIKFVGYEIDKHILSFFKRKESEINLKIKNFDYLESNSEKFDAIICNPPYMRFQKFLKRHDVLPKIEKQIGKKLAGYSNISSVFLVKALNELNDNGNLAIIMPFEFFNTGYGKEIKKSLIENHLLKQIVIFSNEKDIFPDVTTTICILLCKKNKIEEPVKITEITSNNDIKNISDISSYYQRTINLSDLVFNKKWTPILLSLFSESSAPSNFIELSFYGSFKRGIATGANDFFSLTRENIKEWVLDNVNISKCITKSSQIKNSVFTESDFDDLYDSNKPVYCLNVVYFDNENVKRYVAHGEKLKFNQRFLTKNRNPWYRMEYRTPAPILFGVFNRGRFKVIRNFTTAVTFTCFHSFYPNIFGEQYINKIFVYLLSDIGQEVIKNNKRSYGDNLDKFEPNDLNKCLCPSYGQFELISQNEANEVIETAKTNTDLAIKMSNSLIERITKPTEQQDELSHLAA